MNREEQIRQAANEFAYSLCSIRPEFNADSFVQGAKWSDANPKHYSFKEGIMSLLDKKIYEAIEISKQDHGSHNNEVWSNYYSGIAHGLREAKSIIGMLDRPNNK